MTPPKKTPPPLLSLDLTPPQTRAKQKEVHICDSCKYLCNGCRIRCSENLPKICPQCFGFSDSKKQKGVYESVGYKYSKKKSITPYIAPIKEFSVEAQKKYDEYIASGSVRPFMEWRKIIMGEFGEEA